MAKKLRVAIAQLNLLIGDIDANVTLLLNAANYARDTLKADIIVYPELCITGYPSEDLLLRKAFLDKAQEGFNQFKDQAKGIYCLISHPHVTSQGLMNSCSIVHNGTVVARYNKQHLPNYGVFDEVRYFASCNTPCVVPINGVPVGLVICEDAWFPGPIQQAANQGARLILSPNASPFELDKHDRRYQAISQRAKTSQIPIVYVNNVGGQDDIVFDGGSMVVDQTGKICQHAGFFKEAIIACDMEFTSTDTTVESTAFTFPTDEQKIYDALVLGVKDYVNKNKFPGVLIGISGGMDSALTLAIAVDALGKEKVTAVVLPSRFTSEASLKDGLAVIQNTGVKHETISIEPSFSGFLESLSNYVTSDTSVSAQNLQSRCRGTLMMALSNQTGRIVLTTSNRSEMAMGYFTLYGDAAGGFAVLKDIPKTMVYRLAHFRNAQSTIIPQEIFDKAPSAELAPNQKDEDTLPPYPVLDEILELYINKEQSINDIIAKGFDRSTVERVVKMLYQAEHKRRQCPVGVRIAHKGFGRDYRYPITSNFRD